MLPSCLATLGLFAFSSIFLLLYRFTQYSLFHLSGIFLLLLAAVNFILIIFNKDAPDKDAQTESVTESIEQESEPQTATEKKASVSDGAKKLFKRCAKGAARVLESNERIVALILLSLTLIGFAVWFGGAAWMKYPTPTLEYWHLALVAILFVVTIVADNLCKHASADNQRVAMLNRNACLFFKLTKILLVLIAAALTLKLLNIFDICIYILYAIASLFYYVVVMIALSVAVRAFRKELISSPGIVILLPFLNSDIKELAVISFLEDNTGITLRSLWSLKFLKHLLPYSIVCAAILLWASTGIVYVQSHQEAAVYRLGTLQDETLSPGLHMTLPYPFDSAEIHDTTTINKVTIGYKSTENIDNVWTESHGEQEYRLLLGSGTELVSINLRLEYRIGDLNKYLRCSSSPEKILEAKAYELVTSKTIDVDLDTMLSTDRAGFSADLQKKLTESINEVGIGIKLVNVILESIHPPVEVASVYQDFIAAELQAEKELLTAQAKCIQRLADAQTAKETLVNYANIDYNKKTAAATTELSEFMAAISASAEYPDEYKYYKYLDAICKAYNNSRLVIVGSDIDSSRIYFGSIPSATE